MRPVRLELDGFAAFREPTTVDFTGVDYFALVGPTGAGKSTVIDAMTFALYGSVPRWDDRRTVALALSPTANRGTVRLLFDVGSVRYVVARELRRSATGSVTVRNARLERLVGESELDESETEVLAHDGAVSKAVEELLGLPFEQFCICVVLPQGDFAQFLHAKPADRQRTLTRILGLSRYEAMAREAANEAKLAAQRADVLGEQLAGYADADQAAEAQAAEREAELAALVEWVDRTQPELLATGERVAEMERDTRRLADERTQLAAVAAPEGLDELAERARRTGSELAEARRALAAAERADNEARARQAGVPDREPLRQRQRDHAERAELTERAPELRERWEAARRATETAGADAEAAAKELAGLRNRLNDATAALRELRTRADRLAGERERLAAVRVPDSVAELGARRRASVDALAAARRELAEAERADLAARDELAQAPDRAQLEQARRDHAALAEAQRARDSLTARYDQAAARTAEADRVLAAAEHALAHARAQRDAAARVDLVAAVRPRLRPGQPCPVCTQQVHRLPPPAEGGDLAAADREVQRAGAHRDRVAAGQRKAAEAEHRTGAELDTLLDRVEGLRAALADAPANPNEVDALLAESNRLAGTARAADERLRNARREREAAEAAGTEVIRGLAASFGELRAARDPLVELGAPGLDSEADDPAAAWRELARWASEAAGQWADRESATRKEAEGAERAHAEAERALREAEEGAERADRARTGAVRAEQDAHNELTRADRRREELAEALEDGPDEAEVTARLGELDELDAEVRAADERLRAAREAAREARTADVEVSGQLDLGWRRLRGARDPLVGLGAPVLDRPSGGLDDDSDDPDEDPDEEHEGDDPDGPGDHLVGAWRALTGWAERGARDRAKRLMAAAVELADTRRRWEELQRELLDALAEQGIEPPQGEQRPVATWAPAGVSAALERARAATARLVERRAAAARLTADRAEAEQAHQVAKMLAGLLRSDAFPRWLVASALDTLVADASRNLEELSGGQFELAHSDGEFVVVDHADADARRPVKTLSGGETFQASLALALALSEQLSTLAAAGAVRLDSIFLDEGFGTLDEANLEVVAATLENLASLGDRMVGVITHVPALAERVPVRFAVSRDQRTATITREMA
ncbi:SMC family ATPase [Pseudonocardia eucalypti]|uniref:Nuclease SbcCD subunit C n=1 Tax=Pseudonocardia eucalypti TaxID=648755 RepID=A0ABP9QE58_9PSEU|nr:exonuclease SbcC [Pseudonocardia eucalypti]